MEKVTIKLKFKRFLIFSDHPRTKITNTIHPFPIIRFSMPIVHWGLIVLIDATGNF